MTKPLPALIAMWRLFPLLCSAFRAPARHRGEFRNPMPESRNLDAQNIGFTLLESHRIVRQQPYRRQHRMEMIPGNSGTQWLPTL